MEPEIVDMLLPNLKVDFLFIGQSKGKFGGGKRKIFRQVQKKTSEGNKPSFAVYAVIGKCREVDVWGGLRVNQAWYFKKLKFGVPTSGRITDF